jgi:Fe-S cluster assembly ATP-binding protein
MYDGEDILALAPEIRAQRGIFLAFQHPTSIPGLTISEFLRAAYSAVRVARKEPELTPDEFRTQLTGYFTRVGLRPELLEREVNTDLSGGEKKRLELVQLLTLNPTIAVLDETDSGLDIDALKIVATIVRERVEAGLGALVITHYQRLLDYLAPSQVHVMMNGKLVAEGGAELTQRIEEQGYESFSSK